MQISNLIKGLGSIFQRHRVIPLPVGLANPIELRVPCIPLYRTLRPSLSGFLRSTCLERHTRSLSRLYAFSLPVMDPFHAKMVAAATGSTLTALTSTPSLPWVVILVSAYYVLPLVTPFDVVKTRLQTQPPRVESLFPRPPANTCCQPTNVQCVRRMSSLARSFQSEVVCVWEGGVFKTERVNGFADAIRHVWRAEGVRGLWKGTGTTL